MLINIRISQTSAEITSHQSTWDWKSHERSLAVTRTFEDPPAMRTPVHIIEGRPEVSRDSRFAGNSPEPFDIVRFLLLESEEHGNAV